MSTQNPLFVFELFLFKLSSCEHDDIIYVDHKWKIIPKAQTTVKTVKVVDSIS